MKYKIHESSYVDDEVKIGDGTVIWHFCHIMNGSVIGSECRIGQNVVISPGVTLGDNCKVQNNVSIYTGVICDDDVFIGPSVVFTNVINPRSAIKRTDEFKKTIINRGVSLGANCTIVCGVEIGEYAFVGAGSVVTRNVPNFALVIGNPARVTGWMDKSGNKLVFNSDNLAIDHVAQEKYKLVNNQVIEVI
ncbi:acetyltransferase [Schleiferiaceae bacterium]|nr:acetyltransferase [Schleiferiaceae bacterium]